MSFFAELKRRNVFRVGAAYVAISWLIIEVVETLFPIFGLGNAAARAVIIVLAIAFVPTVIFAWAFELTPEGLQRDSEVDRASPWIPQMARRLDRLIVVVLAFALGFFAWDKFFLDPARDRAREERIAQEARQAGRTEALVESYGDRSVAVLPFANMSPDPDQAFFSDGISEDILSRLSRTGELRVISRSSSFLLRGEDLTIPEIAQRLDVSYVLNGSVRKQADEVRVSVRLVNARSDVQVWAETYERKLDDIFAIQDEISAEVVSAVEPTLLGESLHRWRSPANPDTYVQYLKARHVYFQGRSRSDVSLIRHAMGLFESVLEADPDYAPAQAGIADAWGSLAIVGAVTPAAGYEQSRRAATKALALDDALAEAWLALADIQLEYDWDLRAAGNSYRRALRIDPQNAEGLRSYAFYLLSSGRADESIATYRESIARDPLSLRAYFSLYLGLLAVGEYAKAEEALQEATILYPALDVTAARRHSLVLQGRIDEAAELLPAKPSHPFALRDAAMIYHDKGEFTRASEYIGKLIAEDTSLPKLRMAAGYYARSNQFDLALESLEKAAERREINMSEILMDPHLAGLREDLRFWALVDRAGIVMPTSGSPE